jgi:hypothetical protein
MDKPIEDAMDTIKWDTMGGQRFAKIFEKKKHSNLGLRFVEFGHWILLPWLKTLVQMRCYCNRRRGNSYKFDTMNQTNDI